MCWYPVPCTVFNACMSLAKQYPIALVKSFARLFVGGSLVWHHLVQSGWDLSEVSVFPAQELIQRLQTVRMAAVMAWFSIAPIEYTLTHVDFWSEAKGRLYFGNTSVSYCRAHSRQTCYCFPVPWTQSNTTPYSSNVAAGQALLLYGSQHESL